MPAIFGIRYYLEWNLGDYGCCVLFAVATATCAPPATCDTWIPPPQLCLPAAISLNSPAVTFGLTVTTTTITTVSALHHRSITLMISFLPPWSTISGRTVPAACCRAIPGCMPGCRAATHTFLPFCDIPATAVGCYVLFILPCSTFWNRYHG